MRPSTFDLSTPPLMGLAATLVVLGPAYLAATVSVRRAAAKDKKRLLNPLWRLNAGPAWTASDSWMTNASAIAGLASAIWQGLIGGSPPLISSAELPGIAILFITFAAVAGLAPVIYAACASQTNSDQSTNIGTVLGYLLAGFATLFAAFGELTALGMFITRAVSAGSAANTLLISIGLGGVFVGVYAWRTMFNVLTTDVVVPTLRRVELEAGVQQNVASDTVRSLLVPVVKRSATL